MFELSGALAVESPYTPRWPVGAFATEAVAGPMADDVTEGVGAESETEPGGAENGVEATTPSGALVALSVDGVPKTLPVILPFCPNGDPIAVALAAEMPVESP